VSRIPIALAVAGAAFGLLSLAPTERAGPEPARAADCLLVEHSRKHVHRKKVRRAGKTRTVKRKHIHRWTTCEPIPEPPLPLCSEPSSTLGVTAYDNAPFPRYVLSRPCVTAGSVTVSLNNQGEDPHNVFLRPAGAGPTPVHRLPDTDPYELGPLSQDSDTFSLSYGNWYLWCSLQDHEANGMYATLQVR
jgi:hypothetical protein